MSFLVYAIALLYAAIGEPDSGLERVRIRYLSLGLTVVVLGTLANFVPSLKPYPVDMVANVSMRC